MKKHMVFRIDMETGEVEMEAIGYTGTDCKNATAPFERALGNVTDRTMKSVAWNTFATTEERHIDVNGGQA